jgi:hypothetical protein
MIPSHKLAGREDVRKIKIVGCYSIPRIFPFCSDVCTGILNQVKTFAQFRNCSVMS